MSYQGAAYRGWQRQAGVHSVQEVFETTLSKVCGEELTVTACGRTDAGVHARQFIVHVDIAGPLHDEFMFRLNKNLPTDIAVYGLYPVAPKAHARYDATERTYNYYFHQYADPFLHNMSSLYQFENLNLKAMAQGLSLLPQYRDYAMLCKKPDKHNTTICNITEAQIFSSPDQQLCRIQISANRFLMGMIRMLVHELLDLGQGKLSLGEFTEYLELKHGPERRRMAHPQGLYLSRVVYPDIDIPPQTALPSFLKAGQEWVLIE